MTTYYLADDSEREPCIWARDQITLEPFAQRDIPVLRRCDLAPEVRRFWSEIVARVTASATEPAQHQDGVSPRTMIGRPPTSNVWLR